MTSLPRFTSAEIQALPARIYTSEVRHDTILHRPLDAEALAKCPRVAAAATAIHQARRESYEAADRIMLNKTWDEMWPEYQAQLRREAQAIVWAIDSVDRATGAPTGPEGV